MTEVNMQTKDVGGLEAFVGTLEGIRVLFDATTGQVVHRCDQDGSTKPLTIVAEERGFRLVARSKATAEAAKAYQVAWSREHKRPPTAEQIAAKEAKKAESEATRAAKRATRATEEAQKAAAKALAKAPPAQPKPAEAQAPKAPVDPSEVLAQLAKLKAKAPKAK